MEGRVQACARTAVRHSWHCDVATCTAATNNGDEPSVVPMPSPEEAPSAALSGALLQSIGQGAFPQDEHVASATVAPSALPALREVMSAAREDTKAC